MNRLKKEWTPTLEEVYGDLGKKGTEGEKFCIEVLNKDWGCETIWHESNKIKQIQGIDIEFKKPKWANFYYIDVKNNMNDYGTFQVHRKYFQPTKFEGKIYEKKWHRIFHVNPTTGWYAWYTRDDMEQYYDFDKEYITIVNQKGKVPSFISRNRLRK